MNIHVEMTGTSPLLMHNPQMVDPENPINREIGALTAKRKKTDEDLKKIAELEWHGGLYTMIGSDGKVAVCQPTSKARKCFIMTARIMKMGKSIERALSFKALNVPLIYKGPRDPMELIKDPLFTSRLSVGIMGKRVMRVRPQFNEWKLEIPGIFVEDAGMNFEDLVRIVEMAGVVEGIGDNRVNGYGRFTGKVTEVK